MRAGDLGVRVEDNRVPERVRRIARALAHPEAALRDTGAHIVRRIVRSMPRSPKGESAAEGGPPHRHAQDYARTIEWEVQPRAEGLRVGSNSPRARILQEGGIIRPVRASMLAIPIADRAYGKRPRDFGGLKFGPRYRRDGQRKVLLGFGAGDDFRPMFVLQEEAHILPHPHYDVTDDDWSYLARAMQRQADREAKGA